MAITVRGEAVRVLVRKDRGFGEWEQDAMMADDG